jgi:hypothetical protein
MTPTNVDWLDEEGLIKKGRVSHEHRHVINAHLTELEIQTLIAIRDKFGEGSLMYRENAMNNDLSDVF